MKRVYVLEVQQHHMKRYVGVADARSLVRLASKVEFQAPQEAQRPISEKRLHEIAEFVSADEGILSTSIVIGTCNDKLNVHPADYEDIPNLFYIDFPETEDEYKAYEEAFDIMDGQHRLFSFLEKYRKIEDDKFFDLTFELYIKPTVRERRIIFKNTNEKQEKVPSNLLMWFRERLGMLKPKEQTYHPVVTLLNTESRSPLKGRIIMGAEKITGGFKAEQIITILDKSDIKNIARDPLDDDKMLSLISSYLNGWELAVGAKIADRDKELGPFSKISGFRFMILMLPAFYDQAVKDRSIFNETYISNKIKALFADAGMEARDLFDKSSDYIKNSTSNPFVSETAITMLAKEWSNRLKSLSLGSFDPLVM